MNCFGLRITWFIKRSDDSLSDVSVDDDLTLVNDTLGDQDLAFVDDNYIRDSPAVDNPLPDITLIQDPIPPVNDSLPDDNPIHDHPAVTLPVVNHSTYHLPTVENNLLDLPNHIISDILIRLQAGCVFRCQRASKLLEILAKTPFFTRKHLAQAASVIALQSFSQSSDREIKFYFMDEHAKKVEESNLKLDFCYLQKNYPVMLYDSYDGFLLLKNKQDYLWGSIFVIWNPTTEEQVTITMEGLRFQVCGFYFNPHNKEYEVLFIYHGNGRYAFEVLSLGSKLKRNIGVYSYAPRSERPPTIINGTLYWMVDKILSKAVVNCSNSIMTFEIGTNKLSTMQHGGASCEAGYNFGIFHYKHHFMHLIEIEGKLGLCVLLLNTELVLWVLNPATNSWAKTHSVTLPEYSMPKFISGWPNKLDVEAVKIKDGKLLVRQKNRLLLWDLDLNTHKIVEKKGFEKDIFRPVIHTPTLVSLDTDKLIELTR